MKALIAGMKGHSIGLVAFILAGTLLLLGVLIHAIGAPRLQGMMSGLTFDGSTNPVLSYALGSIDIALIQLGLVCFLAAAVGTIVGNSRLATWFDFLRNLDAKVFVAGVLVVSAMVNCLIVFALPFDGFMDPLWYHQNAINLAHGLDIASLGGLRPTAYWPVGYPLFLAPFYAVFGSVYRTAQLVNVALKLCISALTYLIGRRAFNEAAARVGLLVIAFYPNVAFYTVGTDSDILFSAIVALVAYILVSTARLSWRRSIVTGLIIGLSAYVRPTTLALPFMVLAWYWLVSRKLGKSFMHTCVVTIIMFSILAPWIYRNYQSFGRIVLVSTHGGFALWLGINPLAGGGGSDVAQSPFTLNDAQNSTIEEPANDARYRQMALNQIVQHPVQFVSRFPRKLFYLYGRDDQAISHILLKTYDQVSPVLLGDLLVISYSFSFVVSALTVLYLVRQPKTLLPLNNGMANRAFVLVLLLVYNSAIYMVFASQDRYKLPVLFIMSLFAAVGGTLRK